MKKSKKTIAVAAAFAVALGTTACVPDSSKPGELVKNKIDFPIVDEDPDSYDVPCVYGPAIDYDPDEDDIQTEYGVPEVSEYDPYDDEISDVYGPPVDEWDETED